MNAGPRGESSLRGLPHPVFKDKADTFPHPLPPSSQDPTLLLRPSVSVPGLYFVVFCLNFNGIRSYYIYTLCYTIFYRVRILTSVFVTSVQTREGQGSFLWASAGLLTPGFSMPSLLCLYLVFPVGFDLVLWGAHRPYGADVLLTGTLGVSFSAPRGRSVQSPYFLWNTWWLVFARVQTGCPGRPCYVRTSQ